MPDAPPLLRTPLFQAHVSAGARIVPFGGWEMPLQYQGILAEARAVRAACGVFDVSHMGRLWIQGPGAGPFLQHAVTADVLSLRLARARYCFILNQRAGVIDDCIVTRLAPDRFLLVCNAGNRPVVVSWLRSLATAFDVSLTDATRETAMIAVQGPSALQTVDTLTSIFTYPEKPSALRFFASVEPGWHNAADDPALVSRTGYAGEDGVEIVLPASRGPYLWLALLDHGATPCGLGARDVLRLEAALPLHGNDLDDATTPLEAGLERFVAEANTQFIGRDTLERQRRHGLTRRLVGFRATERGIPRHGCPLLSPGGATIGVVTSGGHSPTLDAAIGLGYVKPEFAPEDTPLVVDIRGRLTAAQVVPLPFYSRNR